MHAAKDGRDRMEMGPCESEDCSGTEGGPGGYGGVACVDNGEYPKAYHKAAHLARLVSSFRPLPSSSVYGQVESVEAALSPAGLASCTDADENTDIRWHFINRWLLCLPQNETKWD